MFVFRNEYSQDIYPDKSSSTVILWKISKEGSYARVIYSNRSWWWLGLNFDWVKTALETGGYYKANYSMDDAHDDVCCHVIQVKNVDDDPVIQEAMDFHKVFTLDELIECYWIDCLIRTGDGHQELVGSAYVDDCKRVSNNAIGRYVALFIQEELSKGVVNVSFSESEKWRVINTRDGYLSIYLDKRTRRRRVEEFYPEVCLKVENLVSDCEDALAGCCFCIEVLGVESSMRLGRQKESI